MRFATVICLALTASVAYAEPTDIDDPDTVKYLQAVHESLGKVSRAITACADAGGDRRECVCEHEDLLLEFNAAVNALLEAHPEVRGYQTVNYRKADGGTVAQNIPGLILRAESPPDCS